MISRVDFGDIRDWKKVGVSLVGVKECVAYLSFCTLKLARLRS